MYTAIEIDPFSGYKIQIALILPAKNVAIDRFDRVFYYVRLTIEETIMRDISFSRCRAVRGGSLSFLLLRNTHTIRIIKN